MSQPTSLPLIPLAPGSVLLPGLVQRIIVNPSRPDIPTLLASVYERAAAKGLDGKIDEFPIACVPVSSSLIGPDGQLLLSNGEDQHNSRIDVNVNTGHVKKGNIFKFGVAAKILGIDGRGDGEFALRVEGTARIRIDSVTRERPFFEGRVTYFSDESML